MTTNRGPAVFVLTGERGGELPRTSGAHALVGEAGKVKQLEELPEVGGLRLGRVVLASPYPEPDRYLPPLYCPPATVTEGEGRIVLAYPRGFRGVSGERGAVVELLDKAAWERWGFGEIGDQAEIDAAVGALPRG